MYKIIELIPQNREEDYNLLLPAFLSIWNNPENHKYLSLTLQMFNQEMVSYWFKNHLDLGGHYFAAVDVRNNILGLSVIKINQIEVFEIYGLAVLPEYKNKGIGSSLIKNAVDNAAILGYKAVEVSVYVDNIIMMRLLLAFNFIPVRLNYHARADGTDILIMKKYL